MTSHFIGYRYNPAAPFGRKRLSVWIAPTARLLLKMRYEWQRFQDEPASPPLDGHTPLRRYLDR